MAQETLSLKAAAASARRRTAAGTRTPAGEVLVTDTVLEAVRGSASHLRFEGIGEVKLKGFDTPRRLCRAAARHA